MWQTLSNPSALGCAKWTKCNGEVEGEPNCDASPEDQLRASAGTQPIPSHEFHKAGPTNSDKDVNNPVQHSVTR